LDEGLLGVTVAGPERAGAPDRDSLRKRVLGPLGVALGAGGLGAGLTSTFIGMREVMIQNGGFCATGGPYAIRSECSSRDVALLTLGIVGALLAWAIYAGFTAWLGGPVLASGLLLWAALFGALGWNFMELGLFDPVDGTVAGWLVSGIVFWLMAAGGLVPAVLMALAWLRRGGEPEPRPSIEPLVRATVSMAAAAAPEAAVTPARSLLWAAATALGAAAGVVLAAALL
jgi:hypothetical protein